MMTTPPPAKRQKLAPSDGDGAAAVPGCWALPQALMIAMMFLVRMRVRVRNTVKVKANFAQISSLIQLHVDLALHKSHEMFSRKIEGLQQEMRQLARPCSKCHSDQHTRLEPNQEHAAANGSNTNIRLRFLNNNLKKRIYSERNITNKNNAAIKVAIFDGDDIIRSGELSKVKVEILVLRGDFCDKESEDWTEEKFDSYIDNNIGSLGTWRLTKGEVDLSQIRFNKGTNRRQVIMAARVCKGKKSTPRVQGAIMNPVVVLDRRNEGNEKRYPPTLDDEVFRLKEISRNGPYRGRLREAKIFTVEDFLKAFYKDHKNLRKILQMENKRDPWSKLTRHATQCVLEDRQELKRYQSEDGTVVLFFNCVHNIVGADFGCGYVASGAFTAAQKASVNKWKICAYENLDGIPADFIITNPRRISTSTDAASGPSNQVVDASQPNVSADHPTQGIGAAENSPCGDSNHITPPIYPTVNSDHMISAPGYPNTQDNQAQGTALPAQQPTIPDSVMPDPDLQQNFATMMDFTFEFASTSGSQFPEGWNLSHIDICSPSSMPVEATCYCFSMGALQPSCAEHGQGPSSAFPGSGRSNDYQ